MIADNSPLCCCEYLDIHEERNHILACCCNCQDFDEGFDSFISGRGIPRHSRTGFMATLHDRLRIPWKGGAKRISIEATISIILVPIFLLVASINPVWTAMSALTMIGFLIYVRCKAYDSVHGAKFFHAWVNTSFVALYFIFEFVVIPFLEILWEENIALSVVIALSCFWFWKVKKRRVADSLSRNCLNCMTPVPNDSRHVAWLDCCIGRHNSRHYIFGLAATVTALLYGCNLTFTTICHPFTWFATILLPDDCTEAYDLFELSLSFVSGLYCLALAIYMLILLLHQVVLTIMYNTCVSSPVDKKENDNFIA